MAIAAPARQGATQGHGSAAGTSSRFRGPRLAVLGEGAHPSPQHGEESEPAPYPPARAQEVPLSAQYQVLCLASSGALLGKDRASLFQPCAAKGLNGRLYAVAAVTSHTLATANGSK